MTPAVDVLRRAGTWYALHEYSHSPAARSYGLEAAEKLGFDPARVLKTLVIELEPRELAVAIVPVDQQLDLKAAARALGAKKANLAELRIAERTTGYVAGGVSPLGQRKRLRTAIEADVEHYDTVYVSGGRRGLDVELRPADLVALTGAVLASLSTAPRGRG